MPSRGFLISMLLNLALIACDGPLVDLKSDENHFLQEQSFEAEAEDKARPKEAAVDATTHADSKESCDEEPANNLDLYPPEEARQQLFNEEQEVLVSEVNVGMADDGILIVTAFLGFNACDASKYQHVANFDEADLKLTIKREAVPENINRICRLDYKPVFAEFSFSIPETVIWQEISLLHYRKLDETLLLGDLQTN